MYLRVAQRLTLRTAIALSICLALLPIPGISLLLPRAAQGQGEERKAKPKPGKPEGVLPDLDDIKRASSIEPQAPPPIPSTIRSKKNSGRPWGGRRAGDPDPSVTADAAGIYYTQQTYGWQRRPLITTNPDLTTREASYAGCGCAPLRLTARPCFARIARKPIRVAGDLLCQTLLHSGRDD